MPKEDPTRWQEKRHQSNGSASTNKIRKRHIHSSAKSLIRCQTERKIHIMKTQKLDSEHEVKPETSKDQPIGELKKTM
jgi:hypothetical protein